MVDTDDPAGGSQSAPGSHVPAPSGAGRRAPFFLRSRSLFSRLLALPFAAACVGVVALAVIYHWPTVNAAVCFFTVCPIFICFGALLPFVLAGFWGVRRGWFLLGCLLWASGLATTDDVAQWLKFRPASSRAAFEAAHASFLHRVDPAGPGRERLSVPLRIVTWNMASRTHHIAEAARELAALEPDIVFLQEADASALSDAMRRSEWFASYHLTARYGRALASRFPIARLPADPLPSWRGDAWQVEVAPGFSVVCINVHMPRRVLVPHLVKDWNLQAVHDAIGQTRQRLWDLRDARAAYAGRSVILAGDFNLPPHYPDLRAATVGLTDCFSANGYGWGKTVPAGMPVFRIDMVFVPPDAAVYYAGAVPTRLSDHYMTMAEVAVAVTHSSASPSAAGEVSVWNPGG
jgi:endonuclease/exonuclease/phosphatase family metal-dependent hydrolase